MLNLNPLLRNNSGHLKMIRKVSQNHTHEAFGDSNHLKTHLHTKHIRNRQVSFATTAKGIKPINQNKIAKQKLGNSVLHITS